MSDLKPCPFCGGTAFIWRTNHQTYIQCEFFDATTHGRHLIQVSGDTDAQAIEAWNRRTKDEPEMLHDLSAR